jgi:hypothetical protein
MGALLQLIEKAPQYLHILLLPHSIATDSLTLVEIYHHLAG